MEIINLDVTGYYFYSPDLQVENCDKYFNKKKLLNECTICKRFILESSYDSITNNKNMVNESEITIGKCGHMYHTDCITSWLKTNNVCPIDKVTWQTYRVADSSTKLILKDDSYKSHGPKFESKIASMAKHSIKPDKLSYNKTNKLNYPHETTNYPDIETLKHKDLQFFTSHKIIESLDSQPMSQIKVVNSYKTPKLLSNPLPVKLNYEVYSDSDVEDDNNYENTEKYDDSDEDLPDLDQDFDKSDLQSVD